jgi:serine/threonine-protein kinase
MELVNGHTLEHVLLQRSKLDLAEALAVAAQAVAGLGYVHAKDVVHRDIKPSNIMLTAEGVLKIMDFGIARVQGAKRLTREGSMMGTLNYASPEQIKRGEGEPRSDFYSLGCVIYEMICGSPPFDGRTEYELMQAHIAEPPESLSKRVSGLPEVVDRAVLRALAKNPDDSFATIQESGQALGIEAIQAKAVKIVHNIVERAGAIPELLARASPPVVSAGRAEAAGAPASRAPRSVPAEPAAGRQRSGIAEQPDVVQQEVAVQQAHRPRAQAAGHRMRDMAPVLAMGGAATVALAVLGFIVLDSVGSQSDSTQTASLTDSSSKSDQTKKDKPETSSSPSTDTSQKPGPGTAPKPPPPPPPTQPPETPAYQGRIVDWIGGSSILVPDESGKGVRFLKLYGVRDVMGTQQQANEVRQQLNAYLDVNGREVTC